MRTKLLTIGLILMATPASAQQVAIGVGPTWRGAGGDYGEFRRDAVTADLQLAHRAGRLGWFAGLSATVGESLVAIPDCLPGFESSCGSVTLRPGSLWIVAGGLAFGPTQASTALGFQARVIARPLPIDAIGFGVDVTYLTSRVTSVRWQLSPRVEVRF